MIPREGTSKGMNRVLGVCIGTKPMAAFGLLPSSMARAEQGRAQAPATVVRVELGPAQVARWLTLATAAVVGSCVFVTSLSIVLGRPFMFGLMPVFDLDREATIPAGYTALLLLSSAILLILVARIERLQGDQRWFYWAILSLGFVYLAADELVAIHERFNRPLRYLLGASPRATAWVIAGALGALAAGIFSSRSCGRCRPGMRRASSWRALSTSAAPSALRWSGWHWATAPTATPTTASRWARSRSRREARWSAWRCSSGRWWIISAQPGPASS